MSGCARRMKVAAETPDRWRIEEDLMMVTTAKKERHEMMNAKTTRDTLVKRGRLAAIAALACCAAATATVAETAKAARPVPRPALAERLKAGPEIIGIVHWGLNTFTDKEWGFGDADPKLLAPAKFDADQIASAAKAGGLGGLVIVCKHHDGFCLWPTKTTEYNITKTPFWRGTGNGERGTGRDYVKEMEQACRRHGLKFGVYVSPWDRNNAHYGTEKYTEIYHAQIKELLGGAYGEVFEMWFDGANGGDGYYGGARERRKIGSADGYYRFSDVFRFVRELQPKVTIFAGENDVSDFRWPGNEQGILVPDSRATIETVGGFAGGKYGNPNYRAQINCGSPNGAYFRACEADFPLRRGWFWHKREDGTTKNAAYLTKLYLSSVGNGGIMNIGLAPNADGLLDAADARALAGFNTMRRALFAKEVTRDGEPFNVVVLSEDLSNGEQVDGWKLVGDGKELLAGKAVGRRRIRLLAAPVALKTLSFETTAAGPAPLPVTVRRYFADGDLVKAILEAKANGGETDTAKWMQAGLEDYDVIVAGGGPAGIGAGYMAAKRGARTLVLEKSGRLGGMAVSAMVSPFSFATDSPIVREIAKNVGFGGSVDFHAADVRAYDLLKETGADVMLHADVLGPVMEGDRVVGVRVHCVEGERTFKAKVVIDATGNGIVAAAAGVPYEEGRKSDGLVQPMSIMFTVGGFDPSKRFICVSEEHARSKRCIVNGRKWEDIVQDEIKAGNLPPEVGVIRLYPGRTKGLNVVNATQVNGLFGSRSADLTKAEIATRKQAAQIVDVMRRHLPGYENARIAEMPAVVGVRETRRFEGVDRLTTEDVLSGRKREDAVARRCSFVIDIHNPAGAGQADGHDKAVTGGARRVKPYDIPYGALVPKKVDGLLFCGRCISASHEALASCRVMGPSMATGIGAGAAAAEAVKKGIEVRAVDAKGLRLFDK